jgi:hypothetical protein
MAYTWNPSDKSASITLSGSDLVASNSDASTNHSVRAIRGKSTGKWYWEITVNFATANNGSEIGAGSSSVGLDGLMRNSATGWTFQENGYYGNNFTYFNAGLVWATGDIISVAIDMDAGKIWWRKNGTWTSGNPADGSSPKFSNLSGTVYPMCSAKGTTQYTANFGDSAFTYSVPSGFAGIGIVEDSTTENAEASGMMEALHLVDSISESAVASDSMDALHLVDSISETAETTDLIGRSIETERSTSESASASDLMEALLLVDSTSEVAAASDAFGNEKTAYGSITESAEATGLMDALHLVDYTTESAVALGLMESADMIRKRIRFPNLQGRHLSLKFESATDGSFALYYLRHKMFKTRELTSDQKHPNTQASHISLKLSNSGSDAFTLMYVSEKMQVVTT